MKSAHHSTRGSAFLIIWAIFFAMGTQHTAPLLTKMYAIMCLAALMCAGYHEWRYSYWMRRHQ